MRVITNILRFVATTLNIALAFMIAAWVVGRLASDRWFWSQWLLWIPTLAALTVAAVGLLLSLRPAPNATWRRRRIAVWSMIVVFIAGYFALIENHLLRQSSRATGGLHVVHWNMSDYKPPPVIDRYVDSVMNLGGDVIILTAAGRVEADSRLRAWLGPEVQIASSYPFTVLSRFPIRSLHPLVRNEKLAIEVAEIDASAELGREIVLYLVDLPSEPRLPRAQTARMLRRLIDESGAPAPDLVVGDFNMTRDSAASRLLFPGLRNAYDEAGADYAASFRRDWPLYHIDHMLLGPDLRALRYELIDPGVSRHRAQAAWIAPR